MMINAVRPLLPLLLILSLVVCREAHRAGGTAEAELLDTPSKFAAILTLIVDPAKLDSLKGKRAATPRLRKACHWLEMARRDGKDFGSLKAIQ